MLVLSRKIGERIRIGEDVDVVVIDVVKGRVKLGFEAPMQTRVRRGELPPLEHPMSASADELHAVAGAL